MTGLRLPADPAQRKANVRANLSDDLKGITFRLQNPDGLSGSEFIDLVRQAKALQSELKSLE